MSSGFGNAENETRKAIFDAIVAHEINRPRALQSSVGCSQLGTVCTRQLAFNIAKVAPSRGKRMSWVAAIGTSVHAYLESIFAEYPERYLTETPVTIKFENVEVPGTVDLYDKETMTVVDFKIVGETTLARAKRGDISDQYLTQINLYALGLQQAGYRVNKVAILFLPKNKELSDAVFVEREPNLTLAHAAMSRFATVSTALAHGAKPKDFTPTDAPCVWCDWFDPAAVNGCPGASI